MHTTTARATLEYGNEVWVLKKGNHKDLKQEKEVPTAFVGVTRLEAYNQRNTSRK
jgi:hypothetical protein